MSTQKKILYKPAETSTDVEDSNPNVEEAPITLPNWHFVLVFGVTMIYFLTSLEIIRISMRVIFHPELIQKLGNAFNLTVNDVYALYIILAGAFTVQAFCVLGILRGITVFRPNWLLPYLISFPFVIIMYVLISLISLSSRTGESPLSLFFSVGESSLVSCVLFGAKYLVILNTYERMIYLACKRAEAISV